LQAICLQIYKVEEILLAKLKKKPSTISFSLSRFLQTHIPHINPLHEGDYLIWATATVMAVVISRPFLFFHLLLLL